MKKLHLANCSVETGDTIAGAVLALIPTLSAMHPHVLVHVPTRDAQGAEGEVVVLLNRWSEIACEPVDPAVRPEDGDAEFDSKALGPSDLSWPEFAETGAAHPETVSQVAASDLGSYSFEEYF